MFADEMLQQPRALLDLVEFYRSSEGRGALSRAAEASGSYRAVTFTGMGSSLYAACAVLPSFWREGWRAGLFEAGELLHYGLPHWRPEGALIAVSQSGESAET